MMSIACGWPTLRLLTKTQLEERRGLYVDSESVKDPALRHRNENGWKNRPIALDICAVPGGARVFRRSLFGQAGILDDGGVLVVFALSVYRLCVGISTDVIAV